MRRFGRTDANQSEIVKTLREHGASVLSLASLGNGAPDLLVSFRRINYLFELKVKGAKQTKAEKEFEQSWAGQYSVIESAEEALRIIGVRK